MAARQPWWAAALLLLPVFVVACEASAAAPRRPAMCPRATATEAFIGSPSTCSPTRHHFGDRRLGVIEGNDATLAWAINFLHRNKDVYVAVLFYASWCPFSRECRPHFEKLAYLFPTIPHFTFEESAIRASTISRYGLHGYPTLFLLNSTTRVRYHGPRTVKPLAAFYNDVSGINASKDSIIGDTVPSSDITELKKDADQENCLFCWARSPEKILQQDTYLVLAISFFILRLLYLLSPKITSFARWTWRCHTPFFFSYLEQGRQKFNRLCPSKRVHLHEGARNATAWASKSLASVSIGEPSTSRLTSTNELI